MGRISKPEWRVVEPPGAVKGMPAPPSGSTEEPVTGWAHEIDSALDAALSQVEGFPADAHVDESAEVADSDADTVTDAVIAMAAGTDGGPATDARTAMAAGTDAKSFRLRGASAPSRAAAERTAMAAAAHAATTTATEAALTAPPAIETPATTATATVVDTAPRPRLPLGPIPQRVLVTGGAGYFGGVLARFLAERGIDVVSLDVLADPDPDPRIVYVIADLRHEDEVRAVLMDQGPFDAIFHCAALMGHEKPSPEDLWEANAGGTRILADAAIEAGVRKLVYMSSICVFGRPFDHPVTEDEPVCPIDPYGRSKLEGERVLAARADRLDADAIRCPTIVSAGRLGLVAILFEFAREGRRIYLVGDGSNRYSFIYALDLAEACLLAARAPGSHVYNVGSDDVKPLREVYAGVIEEAGSSSRLVRLPERPAMAALSLLHKVGVSPLGPYHSRLISGTFVFDTTRIKEDLGWRPTRTNEDMLREAYRFYVENEAERSEELSAHRQGAKMGILRLVKWLS